MTNHQCFSFVQGMFLLALATMLTVSLPPTTAFAQQWLPPGIAKKFDHHDHEHDRDEHNRDEGRDPAHGRGNEHHGAWHDSGHWYTVQPPQDSHRQQTKNNWRNLAIGAGAVALYGYLKHDPTITFVGAAGALYSLNRYEQDRRSQSAASHARAVFFSRPYFVRDGHRYTRRTVTRHGLHYYQFVRS